MKAWDDFIRTQIMELGNDVVERWLKPLKVKKFDACNLYLETNDSFKALWFEEHVRPKVEVGLYNNNNKKIKVYLQCNREHKTFKNTPPPPPSSSIDFDLLAQDHTFDTFIVGEENALAYTLLKEHTETAPETPYLFNPMYLYGPSNVGKTHLLMSLAHVLQEKKQKVAYVKTSTFTEHVVDAIRKGDMQKFRLAYRNVDTLILDDIEVLGNKTATQEELFHTFNTLHTQNKQIVMSGHSPPSELIGIEPRLISRFEWGIVIPMKEPSEATITKIFQHKLRLLHIALEPKTISFLITSFGKSLQSLLQSLDALILRSHIAKHPLTHEIPDDYVKTVLKDLLESEKKKIITPEKIIQIVAEQYGITTEDILGKSQSRECALPRQIAMHLCREYLNMPFMQIGAFFTRDHSTVISSIKHIEKNIKNTKSDLASDINLMKKRLTCLS